MKIFYIADMHIGHSNIIRLCNRPFKDVIENDKTIIDNWNKTVSKDDLVYILGDVAFKGVSNIVDILHRLNGRKILIKGNHDGKNLKNPAFRECFEQISDMLDIVDNGERVILCHYPIMEWNGYFRGSWHVFGHVHNNTSNPCFKYICNELRALNAGVDITGFKPVTLEELKILNKKFKENNSK